MKKYDVFKSQGGYAVALGAYLESPVMGSCRWFETEDEAKKYAKNHKGYQDALQKWENDCIALMPCESNDLPKKPNEKDYNLSAGIEM